MHHRAFSPSCLADRFDETAGENLATLKGAVASGYAVDSDAVRTLMEKPDCCMTYSRTHHTPEEIVEKLIRSQRILAEGASVEAACRMLEIGLSTLYRWRKRYGGMTYRQARQLHDYQVENRQLKLQLTQQRREIRVLRSTVEEHS